MGTMEYGFQREQEIIQKVSKRAFEDGIAYEKELLIKVLESEHHCNDFQFGCVCLIGDFIRLIKGEK